jgi:hypothetical protein
MNGPLTYEKWIAGLRAGQSFVTNGPMLELAVNGKEIGEMLDLPGPAELKVRAKVSSQFPLDRVEVLYNGNAVVKVPLAGDGLSAELDKPVRIDRSGWVALRASGPAGPDVQGELLYAHTSPVYVTVAGKPAGSAEDARYFLTWIDRLWNTVQERDRFPDKRSQEEIQAEVDEARKVYQKMIDRGEEKQE